MRIIAGAYKGLALTAPPGRATRPTLSRIKEALFNILNHQLTGTFMDLYAGSGSVGLEAYSRGCEQVSLVENNTMAIKCIQSNMTKLKINSDKLTIVGKDAVAHCRSLVGNVKFDYVFLDPPYEQSNYDCWQHEIRLNDLINKDGLLIVQHSKNNVLPEKWSGARLHHQRRYGETLLSFYKHIEVDHE